MHSANAPVVTFDAYQILNFMAVKFLAVSHQSKYKHVAGFQGMSEQLLVRLIKQNSSREMDSLVLLIVLYVLSYRCVHFSRAVLLCNWFVTPKCCRQDHLLPAVI